jgi:hypothetical protein
VIYLDAPAGAGFSFTSKAECYNTNYHQMGEDVYEFLLQFFQLFSEIDMNPFYTGGASAAGLYVPAITTVLLENKPTARSENQLSRHDTPECMGGPIEPIAIRRFSLPNRIHRPCHFGPIPCPRARIC